MKNVHGTTLRKFVIFLLDRSSQVVNQNPDRSGPFRTPHDGRKRPPCASFPLFFPIGRKRAPSEALFPRKSSEYLSAHPRTHTHLRAALLHQMKIRQKYKNVNIVSRIFQFSRQNAPTSGSPGNASEFINLDRFVSPSN